MKHIYTLTITSPSGKPCGTIELDTDVTVRPSGVNGFNIADWPEKLQGLITDAIHQDVRSLTTPKNVTGVSAEVV